LRDIVLHPSQRLDLIEQCIVAGRMVRGLFRQRRVREKAEQ
jgi:hypothetical protein